MDESGEWQRVFDGFTNRLNKSDVSETERADLCKRIGEHFKLEPSGAKPGIPSQEADELDEIQVDMMEARDSEQDARDEHARLV